MKTATSILAAISMIVGVGSAIAGPFSAKVKTTAAVESHLQAWSKWQAEAKKLVAFCEATKEYLSETDNTELFHDVFLATNKQCGAALPGFGCDIYWVNTATYKEAFTENPPLDMNFCLATFK